MSRNIEDYTNKYLAHDFEETQVIYRRKKVLEIVDQYKPKNILEIGCGMDSIFNHYKNYNNFVIVEPSEVFCNEVKKSPNYNSKIEIVQDFLENKIENLKNNDFDFIILSGLLHEVTAPNALLEAVFKICKKNTIVHINVPNYRAFHMLWAYESGLIPELGNLSENAKLLQQNTTFDMEKLKEMAIANGFDVIEQGSYFIKPFNHSKMKLCLKNGIINEKLLDGLYKMTKYMPELGSEIFVNVRGQID